jgi:hypothetical protein
MLAMLDPLMSTTHRRPKRLAQVDTSCPPERPGNAYDFRVPAKKTPAFTAASIGEEVEKGRARVKWSVTKTAKFIGITRTYWYVLITGDQQFHWDWVGSLAAEWRAPPGWPILPWGEAEALHALKLLAASHGR